MPDVPHCRTLRVGRKGEDVVGHKRAVSRAAPDLYPWVDFTPYYGDRFADAVGLLQKRKGMEVTRRIGGPTHEMLERAKNRKGDPVFDAKAVQLCTDFCRQFLWNPRKEALDAGFYWYQNRWTIQYSQARPMQRGKPPWVPTHWDCSGFVTNCYYAANAPDPNGRGYDGLGYTGTLILNGTRIARSEAKKGDLFFYGYVKSARPGFPVGSPTHVAMYVGDNMVLSMGSYPMKYVDYRYRHDLNHVRTYRME